MLKKRSERGELDVGDALKEIEEKGRGNFESDNQKTKEIKHLKKNEDRKENARDSVHLKTVKNSEVGGAMSNRKNGDKDVVIEFKEKIIVNASSGKHKGGDGISVHLNASNKKNVEMSKKKSVAQKERGDIEDNYRASRSEGKPQPKIGISL